MVKVDCFGKGAKRKRELHSSTFRRYRQTPNNHNRVKAHAFGREHHGFTLACFFNFGEFPKQESKRTL